jgi:hypothetical protein
MNEQTFTYGWKLVCGYLRLPHIRRIEVARKLGLLTDEDLRLPDAEWQKLVFTRARERGVLKQLGDALAEAVVKRP